MSAALHKLEDNLAVAKDPTDLPPQYQPPKKLNKWGWLWDTFDAPADERKLLFKLDAVLLTFCSLGYFIKNIDQANVSSAYVSGMKEALGMNGNQLTYCTTMWTVGYVIGQIPSNMILTRIAPRYWIPMLEIGWGICTLASYKVKTYQNLYAIRFFVGLFESGFYPAAQYMLGSFYTPSELGKRAVLFHCMSPVGNMFSGILAAAAYTNLDGVNGLDGWKWLFIVDAIITLPIAIAGLVLLPSLPGQKSWKPSFWLSQADMTLIETRMRRIGRAPMGPITLKKVKGYLSNWHIFLLPLLYIVWNNSCNSSSIMSLWLKSFNTANTGTTIKYSVAQINHYILPVYACQAIGGLTSGWLSDGPLRGRRWPMLCAVTLLNASVCIALLILPVYHNIPAHYVLYYLTGTTGGLSGLYFAWANEICSDDNEERALVVVLMNDFAYVVQAIVPNFVWKTVDYPKSTAGLSYSVALSFLITPIALTIRYLQLRDGRKAAARKAYEAHEKPVGGAETPSLEEKKEGEEGEWDVREGQAVAHLQ